MPQSFNLVAQINLQGPGNLSQVTRRIQSQLNGISANVNINVTRGATNSLRAANTQLQNIASSLAVVQTNAMNATNAVRQLGNALNNITNINRSMGRAQSSVQGVAQVTREASTEMAEFGRVSALAVRRFLAFSIPAGAIVSLTVGIKRGIASAIEFDHQMVRMEQVTGKTRAGLSGLRQEIDSLATGLGASSKSMAEISVVLGQAGFSARDTRVAMSALAKTELSPTFENIKDTTEGAIAAMQQFHLQAGQLEGTLGSLNAVAAAFAVESSDIVSAVRHTGGAFESAGGSLNELMALFTSVRATTRESADSIATGFRTIFTRVQRPRTIEFLREFNVELQDMQGRFVGPYEAIKRLSMALKDLDPRDQRFAMIVEELGGYRQVSKVIPLIQQFSTAQRALAVAQAGTNSLAQDAATAQEALAVQINRVTESYLSLARAIGDSATFKAITSSVLSLAQSFSQVLNTLRPLLPMITALAGIKMVNFATQFGAGFFGGLTGGPRKFASGSLVTGSGTGDTVPAMLTPGEFVLNRRAVAKIGVSTLNKINSSSRVQGFAKGGPVNFNPGAGATGSMMTIMAISTVATSFTSTMGQVNDGMSKFVGKISQLLITMEGLRMGMGAINTTFGGIVNGVAGLGGVTGTGMSTHWAAGQARFNRAITGTRPSSIAGGSRQLPWIIPNRGGSRLSEFNKGLAISGIGTGIGIAGAGLAGAGIMYGTGLQEQALADAKDNNKLTGAIKASNTGSVYNGAGYGAMIGGGIGAMFGPLGMLAGGAAGAGIGALVGALQDNTDELRKVNREERLNTSMEKFGDAMIRATTKGDSMSIISAKNQLREIQQVRVEALSSGNRDESERARGQLKQQVPIMDQMMQKILETSGTIGEFENAFGGFGSKLIETMSEMRDISYGDLRTEIAKNIDVYRNHRNAVSKMAEAEFRINATLDSMRKFVAFSSEFTDQFNNGINKIENRISLAEGKNFAPKFTGKPGFGNFSQAYETGIMNEAQFKGAAAQLFGGMGDFGVAQTNRATALATTIQKLPEMLVRAANSTSIDGDQLQTIIRDQLKTLGQGTEDLQTRVMESFKTKLFGQQGGIGDINSAIRQDPTKFAKELMGSGYEEYFKLMDEGSKNLANAANQTLSVYQRIGELESEIARERVSSVAKALQGEQTLFRLRGGESLGRRFSYEKSLEASRAQQNILLGGTGAEGKAYNVSAIQGALSQTEEKMIGLQERINQATAAGDKEGFKALGDEFRSLSSQAARLRQALAGIADSSDRLSAIQNELAALERDRTARHDFAEDYAFGSVDDKVRMQRGVYGIQMVQKGVGLRYLDDETKQSIRDILNRFSSTPMTPFGGKTGAELKEEILGQYWGKGNFKDAQLGNRGEKENELINQYKSILEQEREARLAHIQSLQATQENLLKQMGSIFTNFATQFTDALHNQERNTLTTQKEQSEAQKGGLESDMKKMVGIKDILSKQGFTIYGNQGNEQTYNAYDMVKKLGDIDAVRRQIETYTKTSSSISGMRAFNIANQMAFENPSMLQEGVATERFTMPTNVSKDISSVVDSIREGLSGGKVGEVAIETVRQTIQKAYGTDIGSDSAERLASEMLAEINKRKEDTSIRYGNGATILSNTVISKKLVDFLELQQGRSRSNIESSMKSADFAGEDFDKFITVFGQSSEEVKNLFQTVSSIKSDSIRKTSDEIDRLTKSIDVLRQRLEAIPPANANAGIVAEKKAVGGPIFQARGTDTVPAMLTPGEFVVNAQATKRHRSLLESINKGVMYASSGGFAGMGMTTQPQYEDRAIYRDENGVEFIYDSGDYHNGMIGGLSQYNPSGTMSDTVLRRPMGKLTRVGTAPEEPKGMIELLGAGAANSPNSGVRTPTFTNNMYRSVRGRNRYNTPVSMRDRLQSRLENMTRGYMRNGSPLLGQNISTLQNRINNIDNGIVTNQTKSLDERIAAAEERFSKTESATESRILSILKNQKANQKPKGIYVNGVMSDWKRKEKSGPSAYINGIKYMAEGGFVELYNKARDLYKSGTLKDNNDINDYIEAQASIRGIRLSAADRQTMVGIDKSFGVDGSKYVPGAYEKQLAKTEQAARDARASLAGYEDSIRKNRSGGGDFVADFGKGALKAISGPSNEAERAANEAEYRKMEDNMGIMGRGMAFVGRGFGRLRDFTNTTASTASNAIVGTVGIAGTAGAGIAEGVGIAPSGTTRNVYNSTKGAFSSTWSNIKDIGSQLAGNQKNLVANDAFENEWGGQLQQDINPYTRRIAGGSRVVGELAAGFALPGPKIVAAGRDAVNNYRRATKLMKLQREFDANGLMGTSNKAFNELQDVFGINPASRARQNVMVPSSVFEPIEESITHTGTADKVARRQALMQKRADAAASVLSSRKSQVVSGDTRATTRYLDALARAHGTRTPKELGVSLKFIHEQEMAQLSQGTRAISGGFGTPIGLYSPRENTAWIRYHMGGYQTADVAAHEVFGHATDFKHFGWGQQYATKSVDRAKLLTKYQDNIIRASVKNMASVQKNPRLWESAYKRTKAYNENVPEELFAQLMEFPRENNQRMNRLRAVILNAFDPDRIHAKGFASGGVVGGDSVPAMLTPGEFVLNRSAVGRIGKDRLRMFNKGGYVNYLADGGIANGGIPANQFAETLNRSIQQLQDTFSKFGETLEKATKNFMTSLEGAGQKLVESMVNSLSRGNGVERTQNETTSPANNVAPRGESSYDRLAGTLSESIGKLNDFGTLFGSAVTQFGGYTQSFDRSVQAFAEAMSQEITITVTHNHTVTVDGELKTDSATIGDVAMKIVGPEIDRLKNRLREFGPGIA